MKDNPYKAARAEAEQNLRRRQLVAALRNIALEIKASRKRAAAAAKRREENSRRLRKAVIGAGIAAAVLAFCTLLLVIINASAALRQTQQLALAARPWLGIESSDIAIRDESGPNPAIQLTANFVNSGKTPAFIKSFRMDFKVWKEFNAGGLYRNAIPMPANNRKSIVVPGGRLTRALPITGIFANDRERMEYRNGDRRFYYYGEVIYTDGQQNGALYTTQFCFYYTYPGITDVCNEYNETN